MKKFVASVAFSLMIGVTALMPTSAKAHVYVGVGTPVPVVPPPLLVATVLSQGYYPPLLYHPYRAGYLHHRRHHHCDRRRHRSGGRGYYRHRGRYRY